jgi:Flp pilus assembly protein TadD
MAMTLLAYLPALSAGFIWDDDGYVQLNQTLRSGVGLWRIWTELGATQDYYPLTFTTFWAEYQVWGLLPAGYHLNNVLLHGANVVLLWRLLGRLNVPGALLTAAIFAVHPVHVESVAWITERKNVLSGLLIALSVHAFVSFQGFDNTERTPRNRWMFFVASVGLFFLALLGKTFVVTLPFLLPVITWWQRGRLGARDFLLTIPYFVVAVPLFYVTTLEGANFGGAGAPLFAASDELWKFSLGERFILAGRCIWFYAGKLVYPADLSFVYPRWDIHHHAWWHFLFPVTAFSVPIVIAGMTKRWGRGPLAAVLVFGLSLGPASGFLNFYFQRYSFVADHLQYVASIGLITLFAALATILFRQWPAIPRWIPATLACLLLVVLGWLTWRQSLIYKNLETLWRDTLRKNPDSEMVHTNLGLLLRNEDRLDEAMQHFERALELNPSDATPLSNVAIVLMRQGKLPEAIEKFRLAREMDPRHVEACTNLGVALYAMGKVQEALPYLEEAVKLKPRHAMAHFNLASVLQERGELTRAASEYDTVLKLDPDIWAAHHNLAAILHSQGRLQEAERHSEAERQLRSKSW